MNNWLDNVITPNEIMYIILGFFVFGTLIFLWILNKDRKSSIILTDLISIDGKLDERKFSRFGAWVVSTWGFVYLIINDKFTEWYFIGYMSAWVVNALVSKAIEQKELTAKESHE